MEENRTNCKHCKSPIAPKEVDGIIYNWCTNRFCGLPINGIIEVKQKNTGLLIKGFTNRDVNADTTKRNDSATQPTTRFVVHGYAKYSIDEAVFSLLDIISNITYNYSSFIDYIKKEYKRQTGKEIHPNKPADWAVNMACQASIESCDYSLSDMVESLIAEEYMD